jgi:hypothetical protein
MLVKAVHSFLYSLFRAHVFSDLSGIFPSLFSQGFLDRRSQFFSCQFFVWDRSRASACSSNNGAPEWLVTKKGNNDRWAAQKETSSSSSSTTMVHNARDLSEEPVMGAWSQQKYIVWNVSFSRADITPPF